MPKVADTTEHCLGTRPDVLHIFLKLYFYIVIKILKIILDVKKEMVIFYILTILILRNKVLNRNGL